MSGVEPIAKALTAGLVAFVGAGATAAVDDRISAGEWWTMAAAGLAALASVYAVPNRPDLDELQADEYVGRHRDDGIP